MNAEEEQVSLFDHDGCAGKMCLARSVQEPQRGRTSASSLKKSFELKAIPFMSLDLTPGHGNLLGESYWEMISPLLGGSSMLNTGPAPLSGEDVFSLSRILQDDPPRKYYLSRTACLGILRRAKERGKELPSQLKAALMAQSGLASPAASPDNPITFAAGFCAGAGASAGSIGYQEELSPTLKASASGNMMPTVLCLNDQAQEPICISGNAIDRQPQNGGNGIGYQTGIAYTLTATDHHAVYSRQWVDVFKDDDVASTESARQHKDATDLVCQLADQESAKPLLIRRLTPLECERLQGFPDHWTDLPGASDSSRYKALGNSVAIPCVEYIMKGFAAFCGTAWKSS